MLKVFIVVIALCGLVTAQEADKAIALGPNAVLEITYNNKGTRSEGQTGVLIIDGAAVTGVVGEVRSINGIELRRYPDSSPQLFSIKGWNYSDHNRIRNSWQESAQQGDAPEPATDAGPVSPSSTAPAR